jgi:hypothetical protein
VARHLDAASAARVRTGTCLQWGCLRSAEYQRHLWKNKRL